MRLWLLLAVTGLATGCSSEREPTMRAHELSLAVSPDGTWAAWHGGPPGGSAIYLQRLERGETRFGAPVPVINGPGLSYEPDLAWSDGRLALAWYERDRHSGALSAWLGGLGPRGEREWLMRLGTGSAQARNPVVRASQDTLHVAWLEQDGPEADEAAIHYQRFAPTGTPLAPAARIGRASRETWNLNAAMHEDAFVLVYDAALGTAASELHMIVVRSDIAQHRRLSPDDGQASLYPDLQFSPTGRAALTWFDERDGNREVYLLAAADPAAIGPDAFTAALRVSHTPDHSIGAYVAWNDDVIGLAWSDHFGGRRDVFTRQFDADGAPAGPLLRVGSSPQQAGVPAIRARDGGFLIAWNDYALRGAGAHLNVVSSTARYARVPLSR